jgi:hypothetical protein
LPTKAKTVNKGRDATGEQLFRRDGMDALPFGRQLSALLTMRVSRGSALLGS